MEKDPHTKLHSTHENPFDDFLIKMAAKISPFFKRLNFTPNQLTTISIVLAVLSGLLLLSIKKETQRRKNLFKILAFLCFGLSYFFDCLDGYYARKYDMVTDFGDKYDHYGDFFKCIFIMIVLSIRLDRFKKFIFWNLFFLLLFLMNVHLGCQEKIIQQQNGHILEFFIPLCFKDEKLMIQYTKYLGSGTFNLFIMLFILLV